MPRPEQSGKSNRYGGYEEYDKYQDDNLQENLAGLPLPGPTLVIDLRPANQRNSSLLWNLETEIEDLTAEMRLHHVFRWRYLADCMNFLRVDTMTPGVSLDQAKELVVVTHSDEYHCSSVDDLVKHIMDEFVVGVRNSRVGAIRDYNENSRQSMREEPGQSTVRIFLLIDMQNAISLANAVLFSHYMKTFGYHYDDPRNTGRDESINTIAICMNANQQDRQQMMVQEMSNVNPSRTKFDMIILIQKYRNDDTYVDEDLQSYEVELVLYTLLLVSSEQLSGAWNRADEEDMTYYIEHIEQKTERIPPTPIYMLGLAVTEYSARWGRRWLDYGLASQIIKILRDTTNVGSGNTLLRFSPLNNQDWFDNWWSEAQVMLATSCSVLLSQTEPLAQLQQHTGTSRNVAFNIHPRDLQTFFEQLEDDYEKLEQPSFVGIIEASRQPERLSEMLRSEQAIRDRQSPSEELSDVSLDGFSSLQKQAEHFFSSLFRGAKGTIPRARFQLNALQERFPEIERIAFSQLNTTTMHREFTGAAVAAQRELWTLPGGRPTPGLLTRVTVLSLLLAVGIGMLGWFGLAALLPFVWHGMTGHQPAQQASFQNSFFVTLLALRLCIIVVLAIIIWRIQRQQAAQYEEKQRSIVERVRAISQHHVEHICNVLVARIALSLLEQAGLYASQRNLCRANQHLQRLDEALVAAQRDAEEQQHDAENHLKPQNSEFEKHRKREQSSSNLYVRRDLLPFEQIENTFDMMTRQFSLGTPPLDALAEHLLHHVEAHSSSRKPSVLTGKERRNAVVRDEKQLQLIGSELASAMILSQAINYDLVQIQPLIERYIQQRERITPQVSTFAESVVSLQKEVRRTAIEQIGQGNGVRESRFRGGRNENTFSQTPRPIAETLAVWASSLYQEEIQGTLNNRSITARLLDKDTLPDETLNDLRTRYSLFGYHNAGQMEDDDRFYLLITPGLAADDFFQALDMKESTQAPSLLRLYFPDGEKLIYLHVHRLHLSSTYLSLPQ